MQDLGERAVIVLRLDAARDGQDPLRAGVQARRVVAKRELFAHVHEELRVAGPAEEEVCEDHRRDVVRRAAKAHGELALRHVHRLGHEARLGRGRRALRCAQLRRDAARQGRERLEQCILHAAALGAAAVEQLQTALSEQALAVLIELLVVDLRGALFVAPAAHAVGLRRAHLLEQTAVGPVALVVADGADGVDQVRLFALHILRQEPPAARHGIEKQLAEQLRRGFKQRLAAGGVAVVDDRRDEADALALAALADRRAEVHAVEPVHGGGQTLHVGIAHRAAAEHRRQQRVPRGRLAPQRRHQLRAEAACLEFCGGQIGQINIFHDLSAVFVHTEVPPAILMQINLLYNSAQKNKTPF